MTLMHNEFEGKSEIIFITYDEVIKSPYPAILDEIRTSFREAYKDFLNIDQLDGMTYANLCAFCVQRDVPNIIEYLAKVDFDYKQALKDLKNRNFEYYMDSPLLSIGETLPMLLGQKFTERIYIYTEEFDIRVKLDLQKEFSDLSKITYVFGNLPDILRSIEKDITTYIINDLDYIYDIIEANKVDYSTIMLASYAYNYVNDKDDKDGGLRLRVNIEELLKGFICKTGSFMPEEITEDHLSYITLDDLKDKTAETKTPE